MNVGHYVEHRHCKKSYIDVKRSNVLNVSRRNIPNKNKQNFLITTSTCSSSPKNSFNEHNISRLDDRSKILKNFWYCAALSVDVKIKALKPVRMLGRHLVLFRDASDKQIYCLEDSCPHRRAPLSNGWIYESNESQMSLAKTRQKTHTHVVCPYHGWSFDGTGKVRNIPSIPLQHPLPQDQLISTFDIEEKSGFVWLFFGSPNIPREDRPKIPDIDEFDQLDSHGQKVWATAYGEIEIDAPHFNVFDNAIDISHIHYLHEFGNKNTPEVKNIIMEKKIDNPYSCSGTLEIQNKPVNVFWEWTKTTRVPVAFTAFLPSTSAIKIVLGQGVEMITFVNTVPIDKNKSVNRFCLLRNFARSPLLDFIARRAMLEVLSEDKTMLESLIPAYECDAFDENDENENDENESDSLNLYGASSINDVYERKANKYRNEISVMTDRPQIAFRKLRKSWIDLGYLVDM